MLAKVFNLKCFWWCVFLLASKKWARHSFIGLIHSIDLLQTFAKWKTCTFTLWNSDFVSDVDITDKVKYHNGKWCPDMWRNEASMVAAFVRLLYKHVFFMNNVFFDVFIISKSHFIRIFVLVFGLNSLFTDIFHVFAWISYSYFVSHKSNSNSNANKCKA